VDVDLRAVAAWIDGDPDPADRAALAALLAQARSGDAVAAAALAELFASPLAFGTAGLRGPLRPGPAGMNVAVARRAAAGLAAWLLARLGPGASPLVVIGYDARHGSETFALDSARVFAGAGLRALVLPPRSPTPLLAFAVRHLSADAGVMVTASHNPAGDNGYKVFLGARAAESPAGAGAQLVAPADAEIEAAIARAGPAAALPLADGWQPAPATLLDAYVTAAARTAGTGHEVPAVVAYTPLHGVGAATLAAVFQRAGLPAPQVVAAQEQPDPDFPTTPYPNPEELGTLDLALALGAEIGADLVIANDPDADRCAVAVGGRVLTGDELGLLLADDALRRSPGPVATTIVSSRALRALAAARGVDYRETLTGFKWLMRAGTDIVFAYEEALGYAAAPDLVRDKDGITAALAAAVLAGAEKARGRTLLDRLDDLTREIGVHRTSQLSLRLPAATPAGTIMSALRANPPTALGPFSVAAVVDLATARPATGALVLTLAGGGRVVARPSGTEPKIKFYLEATAPTPPGADLELLRSTADAQLAAIRTGLGAVIINLRRGLWPSDDSGIRNG